MSEVSRNLIQPRIERFITFFVFVVGVIIALDAMRVHEGFDSNRHLFALVCQLLLLNVVHVGFTYSFLIFSNRGHQWIQKVWKSTTKKASLHLAVAFFALFTPISLIVYLGLNASQSNEGLHWFLIFQFLILIILPIQHRVYQTFGLLSAQLAREQSAKHFRQPRLYFTLLCFLGLSIVFVEKNWNLSLGFWKVLVSLVLLTFTIYIFWIEKRETKSLHYYQLISWRLFLWPLAFLSDIALLGLVAIHGIEYFGIYLRLISKEDRRSHIATIVLSGFLILAYFARPLGGTKEFQFTQNLLLISVLSGGSYSLSLIHFWLDRNIFRMRDPNVRTVLKGVM